MLVVMATAAHAFEDGADDQTMMLQVCDACAALAEPPAEQGASWWSSLRQRVLGATDAQLLESMSEGCFAVVALGCIRFAAASDETDPAKAMRVMAILSNFAFCRDWSAEHRHEVTVAQLRQLVAWRERACGLHDEL